MYVPYEKYIVPREQWLARPEKEASLYDYLLACHGRIQEELGDYTAFVTPSGDTYTETPMSVLLRETEQLAAFLAAQGIRQGDAVTAALPPCGQVFTVLFAVNKLGAVLHLLSPETPPDALRAALCRRKSKAVILAEIPDTAARGDVSCVIQRLGEDGAAKAVFSYREAVSQQLPAAGAVSGSGCADAVCLPGGRDGRPVVFSSFALNTQIYQYYLMDMAHDYWKDHALAALPCCTGLGLCAMLYALCNAYKPVLVPRFDAVRVNELLAKLRVIELFGDTALFAALLEAPNFEHDGLRRLRLLYITADAGDALVRRFDEALAAHGSVARLCRCWGPAEMAGAAVSSCWQHYHAHAAGFPLGGVAVEIRDRAGHVLPDGASGEIMLCGDNRMNGYLQDAAGGGTEAFTETGEQRWIRTGIRGRLADDGYLILESM